MRLLSQNPDKRWFERFLLGYSVVWIGIIGALQATNAFANWGDLGHMAIGVGLVLPIWLAPLASPSPMVGVRFNLWIGAFAFLQCYFGSWLFFDGFGMEYHFHVRWLWNKTPLFLYFLTCAYFSTYYLLMGIAWRAFRSRFPRAPSLVVLAVLLVLGYLVALAETATMATERMHQFFSYRDPRWVMQFGSIFYGTLFWLSLPLVHRLDENKDVPPPSLRRIAGEVLLVNMIAMICYEIYGGLLARWR